MSARPPEIEYAPRKLTPEEERELGETMYAAVEASADARRATYNERYETDPEFREHEKQRAREWYGKLDTPARLMRSARARAKKQGVPFAIEIDYLRSIWPEDGRCPVLGFRMVWDTGEIGRSPSLDRFNRETGYVPGNVRIISHRANTIKGDAAPAEMERVLAYLKSSDPSSFVAVNSTGETP